jgi:hypothetical protein
MKPFQTILFLVVIVLIGGISALYWANSVQTVVQVPEETQDELDLVVEEEPSGTYLIFQNYKSIYRMAEGADVLEEIQVVNNPETLEGALVATIQGQNIKLNRYLDDEQDAILSIDGEILEVTPDENGTLVSANGMYKVDFSSIYDWESEVKEITVTNIETEEVLLVLDPEDIYEDRFELTPFIIDNSAQYLYLKIQCGCEATFPEVWRVDIETEEVVLISELLQVHSSWLVDIDPETLVYVGSQVDHKPSSMGPGDELLPPTVINYVDGGAIGADDFEVVSLLNDEDVAWNKPNLDPSGETRYLITTGEYEDDSYYLVNFDDEEIDQENPIFSGNMRGWVGDLVVLWDFDAENQYSLFNIETKTTTQIVNPGPGSLRYIGSITVNE